jgi:Protein of unknown function (DUF2934)
MSDFDRDWERAIRERAYFIWEREGRPEGRADDHWQYATIVTLDDECMRHDDPIDDEEKVLAGRPDANIPAMLTKDVQGG